MEILNCWIIYVLKLEDDCWYVGSTTTNAFKTRMHHHWNHPTKGAMWTRKHKPVRVYSIDTYDRSLTDSEICRIEDTKTLRLAAIHGFESVRGGGFCQAMPQWPMTITTLKPKPTKKAKKSQRALRALAKAQRELRTSEKLLR